jgi:hypothetical protein
LVGDVAEKYRRMHKLRLRAYGVRHKAGRERKELTADTRRRSQTHKLLMI